MSQDVWRSRRSPETLPRFLPAQDRDRRFTKVSSSIPALSHFRVSAAPFERENSVGILSRLPAELAAFSIPEQFMKNFAQGDGDHEH